MKTNRKSRSLSSWAFMIAALLVFSIIQSGSGACETLRFVFMGDSRGGDGVKRVVNTDALNHINSQILALSPRPSMVFFGGDMVRWAINSDETNNFQMFRDLMQPLRSARIMVYYALGNHELYEGGSNYGTVMYRAGQQLFQEGFNDMPTNGPAGYEYLVYSLTSPGGNCFFAILDPYYMDSSTPTKPDDETGTIDATQYAWLAQQIAQTNAAWKFLFIHVPTYKVTSNDVHNTYLTLWSLLDSNRFTIFGAGHEHLYSRKTIDSAVNPTAHNNVVRLITGDAGVPPDTGPFTRDTVAWNIHSGSYYYSVVDVNDNQVAVSTYGGING